MCCRCSQNVAALLLFAVRAPTLSRASFDNDLYTYLRVLKCRRKEYSTIVITMWKYKNFHAPQISRKINFNRCSRVLDFDSFQRWGKVHVKKGALPWHSVVVGVFSMLLSWLNWLVVVEVNVDVETGLLLHLLKLYNTCLRFSIPKFHGKNEDVCWW